MNQRTAFQRDPNFLTSWANGRKMAPQVGIIACVLGLAVWFGQRPSTQWIILIGSLILVVILLHKPELGAVVLLVTALSIPFSLGTGTQTPIHGAVVLLPILVLLWVSSMVMRRTIRLADSSANLPLVCFVVIVMISFIVGNLPWSYFATQTNLPAQLGGLAIFLLSALAFWQVANQIQSLRWLKILTVSFLLIGAIYIFARVVPGLGRVESLVVVSPGGTGSVFWIWLAALAGGQSLFNDSLTKELRIALLGLVLATLGVGWFQSRDWASGWFPPLVGFAVILCLRSPKIGLAILGVGSVMFVANLSTLLFIAMADQYGNLWTWDARLAAWQIVLKVAEANPLLGLGPANYYYYVQLYPILGYYVHFNSHNNFVDLIGQTGLLGLGSFGWFVAALWREGWLLRRRISDGFARGYVYGCLGGLVATLVSGMLGDWFLPFVYNVGIAGFRSSLLAWMFLGGIITIRRIQDRE